MKKIIMILSLLILSSTVYSHEININKSVEESITKDYDQDGKYSEYEKALRRVQKSVYISLPEKRGYWYTILDRIKSEENELISDETAKMRKR